MRVTDTVGSNRFDFAVTNGKDGAPAERPSATHDENLPVRNREPAALVALKTETRLPLELESGREGSETKPNDQASRERRQAAKDLIGLAVDVHGMSPREAADVGLQLYVEGLVNWDEYAQLAFQPELHPSYDATIGALLGETAAPDQPRDFVAQWEERLAYEQRYNAIDSAPIKSAQRINSVLRRLAGASVTIDV